MKQKFPRAKRQPFYKGPKFFVILIGVFLAVIMIGSALNIWIEKEEETIENSDSYTLDGAKVTNLGYAWQVSKGGETLNLVDNPKDLENITINYIELEQLSKLEKVYISINPLDNPDKAIALLQSNIALSRIVPACYKDTEDCKDYPLKNCNDTADNVGIILLKKSNTTKATLENSCLTIEGLNIIKIVEKALLNYYLKKWA